MKGFFYVLLLILLSSCVFIRMDDSIDLGNKYRLIQDSPETIIKHSGDKYEGIGETIVPPQVTDYAFNEIYIIAKSIDSYEYSKDQWKEKYWIIDKREVKATIESMDSISFFRQLKLLNLDLKFKSIK